jgi:hypothetical protein
MFEVRSLVVLLGATLCMLASQSTLAEQSSEGGVVYEAARNKIGLIRHCRSNRLLDPAVADQAIRAVETGLRKHPPVSVTAKVEGDRAQQAGEDGYWEIARRRNIASVARLFRTTPADLCREWADETLRAQAPKRRKTPATIAVIQPIPPAARLPQARPTSVGPTPVKRPPERETAAVKAAPAASPPPVPERLPLSARPPAEAAVSLPREYSAADEEPPLYEEPRPFWGKWPFNRLGKTDKCLMAGCKWPAAQERRPWRY